ncbi:flagellar protein FliT [Gammaproteobacteria bacterium]
MRDLKTNLDPQTSVALQGSISDWDQLIGLTEQMLQTAQEEDWDALAQIEEARRKLLYEHTPSPANDPEGHAAVLRIIQKIIETDRQTIALCEKGQQTLAGQIQSLRVGERARHAYGR